jgi:hypothetical protein
MLAKVAGCALVGLEGALVDVQADVESRGHVLAGHRGVARRGGEGIARAGAFGHLSDVAPGMKRQIEPVTKVEVESLIGEVGSVSARVRHTRGMPRKAHRDAGEEIDKRPDDRAQLVCAWTKHENHGPLTGLA